MKKNRIDKYLDAVEEAMISTPAEEEFWPLKPAQMTAYFGDTLTVDILTRVQKLKERKVKLDKVAKLFSTPTLLRNFLLNFASVDLKVANNLGWFKTSIKEREDFFNYLFDVLEKMVESDIFIEDKKQIILSKGELNKIPWKSFIKLDEKSGNIIKRFKLALFSLIWSLFFDTFYYIGNDSHGPYAVPKIFGERKTLVINDYFNLCPKEIWPEAKNISFEKIRIFNICKDIAWKTNFFSRRDPKINFGPNLDFILIEIDGKIVKDLSKIEDLTKSIFKIVEKQTNFVNNLKPLEQVKKAAEISYYGFRKFFDYFNEDWGPPKVIDEIINKFGDKFIKQYNILKKESKAKIRKKFDPRNNKY